MITWTESKMYELNYRKTILTIECDQKKNLYHQRIHRPRSTK